MRRGIFHFPIPLLTKVSFLTPHYWDPAYFPGFIVLAKKRHCWLRPENLWFLPANINRRMGLGVTAPTIFINGLIIFIRDIIWNAWLITGGFRRIVRLRTSLKRGLITISILFLPKKVLQSIIITAFTPSIFMP